MELVPDLPRPAVLCTIVKITGSHPQRAGAKMAVTAETFHGTLGGGRFEFEVLARARELLKEPGAGTELKEYVLCRQMGQCCGGRASVFFDVLPPPRTAHLFGAGHVGRALAQVLSGTPVKVVLVDPRPEWAERGGLPADASVAAADPRTYADGRVWGPGDAACVFTHSHDLDFAVVRRLLSAPVGYLGLIGSNHKADVFRARLASEPSGGAELAALWDEKVRCPIGLALPSKNPKVIAVAVAAELLKDWALRETAEAGTTR